MPFVRMNGRWPIGEQWILEAWAETYIPLIEAIKRIGKRGRRNFLSVGITPVLADQLSDTYLNQRFSHYLFNRKRQAEEDFHRFDIEGKTHISKIMNFYYEKYTKLIALFEEKYRHRTLDAFIECHNDGYIELIDSSATHAVLPLISERKSLELQIMLGKNNLRNTEKEIKGFWLPECAFSAETNGKHLLKILENCEYKYTFIDESSFDSTAKPSLISNSSIVALPRSHFANSLLWTERSIPSHPEYREFNIREGLHGFQVRRVTSLETPLCDKDVYDEEAARSRINDDAEEFINRILFAENGDETIYACFDAELFGHWWMEGVFFLEEVIERADSKGLKVTTPCDCFKEKATIESISPSFTSWGDGLDLRAWCKRESKDILKEENELDRLLNEYASSQKRESEVLERALRELLLLQSSDWKYMVYHQKAAEYALGRSTGHAENLRNLLCVNNEFEKLKLMKDLRFKNNIFDSLDLCNYY